VPTTSASVFHASALSPTPPRWGLPREAAGYAAEASRVSYSEAYRDSASRFGAPARRVTAGGPRSVLWRAVYSSSSLGPWRRTRAAPVPVRRAIDAETARGPSLASERFPAAFRGPA